MSTKEIDNFFNYGIYGRTLYIGSHATGEGDESGVDFRLAEQAIKGLHILESREGEIEIILNNVGGDEYHGLAIYDAIKACNNHVTIKVFGHAMSMGSIILQAGDLRVMSPNSRIMIHYGTWGHQDHPKSVKAWVKEGERFDKWMIDLYLEKIREKRPRYTRKQVDKMCDFDTIISAEEAVSLGLSDRIL